MSFGHRRTMSKSVLAVYCRQLLQEITSSFSTFLSKFSNILLLFKKILPISLLSGIGPACTYVTLLKSCDTGILSIYWLFKVFIQAIPSLSFLGAPLRLQSLADF